jgi:hypothetical protein
MAAERSRSRRKDSFTFWRVGMFLIRMKFHGCEKPTDGAWCAAFNTRAKTSFGIFLLIKWERTSRLEKIAL